MFQAIRKPFLIEFFTTKNQLHSTPNIMEFMRASMEHLLMWYIFSPRWMRVGWICSLFSSCLYLYPLYCHLIIWYLEDNWDYPLKMNLSFLSLNALMIL